VRLTPAQLAIVKANENNAGASIDDLKDWLGVGLEETEVFLSDQENQT